MEALARRVQELGLAARNRVGAEDLALLKKLKWSARVAEAAGRLCLHFGLGPWSFLTGVFALGYQLAVEAQLNHSIMHGAYKGVPGAGRFTPERYETLAVPFQCKTWGDAHRAHHAHPTLARDPDSQHPLFRTHADQPWRPWHAANTFLGSLLTFELWAFDYDRFLKESGARRRGDRGELGKLALYVAYQYVLFPLLAGARWERVLLGGLLATVLRNLIFTGLQTGSSVGHAVSTQHHGFVAGKRRGEWVAFQIETSKNFQLGRLARLVCGGLDRHIEHHLYPHLPPNRLHALSQEVRALCREHGVRYEEHGSVWGSLRDSLSYLWWLSRPPRNEALSQPQIR